MKAASRADVQKLAQSMLEPAMKPFVGQITAMQAKLEASDEVLRILAQEIRDAMDDKATLTDLKEAGAKLNGNTQQIADVRAQIIKNGQAAKTADAAVRDGLTTQIQALDTSIKALAEKVQDVELFLRDQDSRLTAVERSQHNQNVAQQKILERMSELENLSVKNHTQAINKLSEGLLEVMANAARTADDGK